MSTPEETNVPLRNLEELKRARLMKSIPAILQIFANVDHDIFLPENTEEGEKKFNAAASKFFDEMLVMFSKEGVVREDYPAIFANIKATMDVIESMLKTQIGQSFNEILTTVINITDPMGEHDIAYASHKDIANAVAKLRLAHSGDENVSIYHHKVEASMKVEDGKLVDTTETSAE